MNYKLWLRVLSSDGILGLLFSGFGLFYAVYAFRTLSLGTTRQMGSGYFPVLVALALIACGLWIVIRGLIRGGGLPLAISSISWRAVTFITAATVIFAATINGGGLMVATALATAMAGLASQQVKPLQLMAVTVFLVVFCSLVFVFGLRLPIGLLGTWFR